MEHFPVGDQIKWLAFKKKRWKLDFANQYWDVGNDPTAVLNAIERHDYFGGEINFNEDFYCLFIVSYSFKCIIWLFLH